MIAPIHRGRLLTEYFLTRGILEDRRVWKESTYASVLQFGGLADEIFAQVEGRIQELAERRKSAKSGAIFMDKSDAALYSEPETEHHVIFPLLKAMGWENAYSPQRPLGNDLPDVLLCAQPRPGGWTSARVRREAVAVQENKRWNLPLDSREGQRQAPSTQMLRYLTNAASLPGGKIRWGILTNGRLWRLYSQDAASRSEQFLELDLWKIARMTGRERDHWLRVFLLMFRRKAFIPDPELDGRDFHQYAVNEGRLWERKITVKLSRILLEGDDGVLPMLARGTVIPEPPEDPGHLPRLREAVAAVLFRLLFVLYAEDRGLLRITGHYSMRQIRDGLADYYEDPCKLPLPSKASFHYDSFNTICKLVDRGDDAVDLPPYNGGLFAKEGPLKDVTIPDNVFAPALDALSRWQLRGEHKKTRVNYRDLSVQHIGAVYEQLLEREFGRHPETGRIYVRLSPYARKTGGSYYTPEPLVRLVIERAVGPLVEEKIDAFRRAFKSKASAQALRKLDPARAILNLKICDPAMGSGHFLAALVDYVADRALEAVDHAENIAEKIKYQSPLTAQLADMRDRIRKKFRLQPPESEEIGDRLLMRRLALKSVVHGADKNPMAAELAKLSLWLHTFTIGAPLPFLNHHLRDGDSLFGQDLDDALKLAEDNGGKKLAAAVRRAAAESAELMAKMENRTDIDIDQTKACEADFEKLAGKGETAARFLSLVHAEEWIRAEEKVDDIPANERRERQAARGAAMKEFFSGARGDPESILAEWKAADAPQKSADALRDILARAKLLHSREKPLHWSAEFPGVWPMTNGEVPPGGFDAVIGNPPWDRMKMQEVEWFAERDLNIAAANTAGKRKKMIQALRKKDSPLAKEYDDAVRRIDAARRVARDCGDYPLMSGGDTNLYSLFVERAMRLVRPGGMVGLLTPSGIYADMNASPFFRQMSESGRIAALFDFENRTGIPKKRARNGEEENGDDSRFFPAVDSRFKFCAFVAGKTPRRFPRMECAFFLHSVDEIQDENKRVDLPTNICRLVNPNTGTAPVFRATRDAAIITDIYRRVPVMRDHAKPAVWPVRQLRMLDMTGDSEHFIPVPTWKKRGYFHAEDNAYMRGADRALPLYRGKMIWHFNSRAASVVSNPGGVVNPFASGESSLEQLRDVKYAPSPMFWVDEAVVDKRLRNFPEGMAWMVGFRGIAATTNERTIIAAAIPRAAAGNQLPLILPRVSKRPDEDKTEEMKKWRAECELALALYRAEAPLFLANLCSFALDYVCRQKMQGAGLNWYIMEQLPVIPVPDYKRKFGDKTAAEIVRRHVLELTYAAEDMRPFARDMGYDGDPFGWDEENRAHLRARLDALYFHLYGIGEADAEYIMSSFPIVERNDRKAHDCYRTRDLILEYMRALSAGNADDRIDAPTTRKKAASKKGTVARKRKSKAGSR